MLTSPNFEPHFLVASAASRSSDRLHLQSDLTKAHLSLRTKHTPHLFPPLPIPQPTRQQHGLPIRNARRATNLPPIRLQPPHPHPAPSRIHRTPLPRSGHQRPSRQRCRRRAERFRKTMELSCGTQDCPLLGTHHEGMITILASPHNLLVLIFSLSQSSGVSSSPAPQTSPVPPRTSPSRKTPP